LLAESPGASEMAGLRAFLRSWDLSGKGGSVNDIDDCEIVFIADDQTVYMFSKF